MTVHPPAIGSLSHLRIAEKAAHDPTAALERARRRRAAEALGKGKSVGAMARDDEEESAVAFAARVGAESKKAKKERKAAAKRDAVKKESSAKKYTAADLAGLRVSVDADALAEGGTVLTLVDRGVLDSGSEEDALESVALRESAARKHARDRKKKSATSAYGRSASVSRRGGVSFGAHTFRSLSSLGMLFGSLSVSLSLYLSHPISLSLF